MFKKIIPLIFIFFIVNVFGYDIYSQPQSRVVDYSNVLSLKNIQTLNYELNNIYTKEGHTEIQVVIIPNLESNINLVDLNTKLFNTWQLGDKKLNNGVLITIVTNINKIRISTGSGLEGALPDSYLGRILDENKIHQKIMNKDYYNAINTIVESINVNIVNEKFNTQSYIKLTKLQISGIIIICIILIIGIFIPVGDSVLTFYIFYYLIQFLLLILSSKIGGGGGSSGGGTDR